LVVRAIELEERLDELETELRRRLVVHASVRGSEADVPLLFLYLWVVSEVSSSSRLATEMLALARSGTSPGREAFSTAEVAGRLSTFIGDTAKVFRKRQEGKAVSLIGEGRKLVERYKAELGSQVDTESLSVAAPRFLVHHYAAWIAAHMLNVLTAVALPIERWGKWTEAALPDDTTHERQQDAISST
jgi:hypothetical protein